MGSQLFFSALGYIKSKGSLILIYAEEYEIFWSSLHTCTSLAFLALIVSVRIFKGDGKYASNEQYNKRKNEQGIQQPESWLRTCRVNIVM